VSTALAVVVDSVPLVDIALFELVLALLAVKTFWVEEMSGIPSVDKSDETIAFPVLLNAEDKIKFTIKIKQLLFV